MSTSSNPLAPDPVTNVDGPDVYPPIEPQEEDLGDAVPVGEDGNVETGEEMERRRRGEEL